MRVFPSPANTRLSPRKFSKSASFLDHEEETRAKEEQRGRCQSVHYKFVTKINPPALLKGDDVSDFSVVDFQHRDSRFLPVQSLEHLEPALQLHVRLSLSALAQEQGAQFAVEKLREDFALDDVQVLAALPVLAEAAVVKLEADFGLVGDHCPTDQPRLAVAVATVVAVVAKSLPLKLLAELRFVLGPSDARGGGSARLALPEGGEPFLKSLGAEPQLSVGLQEFRGGHFARAVYNCGASQKNFLLFYFLL